MPLDHKYLKKLQKGFHGLSSGNKSQIAVLAFFNEEGTVLPPMINF